MANARGTAAHAIDLDVAQLTTDIETYLASSPNNPRQAEILFQWLKVKLSNIPGMKRAVLEPRLGISRTHFEGNLSAVDGYSSYP